MRWAAAVLAVLVVSAAAAYPAQAWSGEEILQEQERVLGTEELQRAADQSGSAIRYGESLDEGLQELARSGQKAAGGVVRQAAGCAVQMMAVILLCGLMATLSRDGGKRALRAVEIAGILAISALAVVNVNSMVGAGRTAIDAMQTFANVLLPTVAAVTAATGAVAGAAARQLSAMLFSGLLINLINRLLIPALYGYIALSAAYAALGNEGLKRTADLVRWVVTTVMTAVMLAFVGHLTVSGVVAGSADSMSVRAAKFAISGAIPVVGGILSDASETILASAGVLKSTVGVFGMLTVLSICLIPLLRIGIHCMMFKLVSIVAATVDCGRVLTMVDGIGTALGMMFGMTGAVCFLLLISLVTSVTAVTV